MAKPLVTDDLWQIVGPLLPPKRCRRRDRRRRGGRPALDDRRVLAGIVFVLKSGSRGSTCRKRWAAAAG